MFDSRYFEFAGIAALLVLSPGATLAVVTETALCYGRVAALRTVAGVAIGNSTLALASGLGMAIVLHRWPWALEIVKAGGAVYLSYLGVRGLWFGLRGRTGLAPAGIRTDAASRPDATPHTADPSPWTHVARGITTNLLNPPVILFYMTMLPQFISQQDIFAARFFLLAATHVAMSVLWQGSAGVAVDLVAGHFARPATRRVLEAVTGAVLVGLGARLFWG